MSPSAVRSEDINVVEVGWKVAAEIDKQSGSCSLLAISIVYVDQPVFHGTIVFGSERSPQHGHLQLAEVIDKQ